MPCRMSIWTAKSLSLKHSRRLPSPAALRLAGLPVHRRLRIGARTGASAPPPGSYAEQGDRFTAVCGPVARTGASSAASGKPCRAGRRVHCRLRIGARTGASSAASGKPCRAGDGFTAICGPVARTGASSAASGKPCRADDGFTAICGPPVARTGASSAASRIPLIRESAAPCAVAFYTLHSAADARRYTAQRSDRFYPPA